MQSSASCKTLEGDYKGNKTRTGGPCAAGGCLEQRHLQQRVRRAIIGGRPDVHGAGGLQPCLFQPRGRLLGKLGKLTWHGYSIADKAMRHILVK